MAFKFPNFDDKDLVIFGVVLISVLAIFFLEGPHEIVQSALTGLFGVAVGKSMATK